MADIVVNGGRFNVQHLSQGDPTVVFLHGLVIDNSSSWYYTVANPVAQRSEVVLYDLRGHGLSDKPATGYTVAEQVEDLMGILDALGIDRPVHLVGNSFGGVLAVAAAVLHPERVAGLVLVEAHVAVDGWREQMVGTLEFAGMFLDHGEVDGWLAQVEDRKGKRLARHADTLLHQTSLIDDLASSPAFSQQELNDIDCPVLVICGEHSDVRDWAERLVNVVPACELHLYEGCTHLVVLEAPADVRVDLLAWFERIRAGEVPTRRPVDASGMVIGPEAGGGSDRIVHHQPGRLLDLAARPPWYPADSPWPPLGGQLPGGWQEVMDEFARSQGLDQAPLIPDHRDTAPAGSTGTN
jgi:pimeloyl-ACP methyl ester carboxylesterase